METLLLNSGLLIIGFILLIKGADIFVDGASKIAAKLHIPKILIGLTIVAFGTSAPEFAVSVKSLLAGNGDMLLGNVIGSNILNILLILGLSALFGKLTVKVSTIRKEIPLLFLITLAFSVLILDQLFGLGLVNNFDRQDGLITALIFAVFLCYLIGMARSEFSLKGAKAKTPKDHQKTSVVRSKPTPVASSKKSHLATETNAGLRDHFLIISFITIIGIVGIVFGSNLVVDSASNLASGFGVSQTMIALTVVALGTSLPELVTSIIATRKGESDIAVGNVVGSNIFNIAIVAGLPVIIFGGIPRANFSYIDLAAMLLSSALLFFFVRNDKKIGRTEGIIFLILFSIYYGYTIISSIT